MSDPASFTPAYIIAWRSARLVLDTFYRTDIYGLEHVPKDGAFVLAGNHASYFDPPAFGGGIPREIAYFARSTLFKPGWPDKLLRSLNSIPVDRDSDSDIAAFRAVFATLKENRGILLFPEGTRSPDGSLQEAKKGVGLIACRAGVPVVPARIFGSYDAYPRDRKFPDIRPVINLVYGPMLSVADYDPGKQSKERYEEASHRIMDAIRKLEVPAEVGRV